MKNSDVFVLDVSMSINMMNLMNSDENKEYIDIKAFKHR